MPRPLKNVPADSLGGRIRAARQRLHLSLAEVAGTEYSTSLISQIERNKIEPSEDSLKYLAKRLNLPLDDLALLVQQRRQSEAEATRSQYFEDQRTAAAQLLELNRPRAALRLLQGLVFTEIPTYLRWRIIALRGQCYFALRQFRPALGDFIAATSFLPQPVPRDQHMEVILLHLHMAAALRELGQYDLAYEQYNRARSLMDASTPLRYVAEAHWGTSLVLYEQAFKAEGKQLANNHVKEQLSPEELNEAFRTQMGRAREHAESARSMYASANDALQAALLDCHIALIEQALHQRDAARQRLQHILGEWLPTLPEVSPPDISPGEITPSSLPPETIQERRQRYTQKERANLVSAAACYLANVERESNHLDAALAHIDLALKAGEISYIVRRADAYMTKGLILADRNDPEAIESFRKALSVLKDTDRVGAMIRVHNLLGAYLIRLGRKEEGQAEMEKAMQLASAPTPFSATAANEYLNYYNQDGESFMSN